MMKDLTNSTPDPVRSESGAQRFGPRGGSHAAARGRVLVSVDDVHKSYGENQVLRGIGLEINQGEVVALAGENGAGKSTLLKVIAGLVAPDTGAVHIAGVAAPGGSVHAARALGVAIVPQELAPVQDLAVYQNIFLGRELTTRWGTLDRRAMVRDSVQLLQAFGVDIDPMSPMRTLGTASQQLVELVKSSSTGAEVLLLDEPTSALAKPEVEHLYKVIQKLQSRGVAMVYTTHKMEEMRAIADRIIVLRDGVLIADEPAPDISDEDIVTAMIGRELGDLFPSTRAPQGSQVVLDVRDLAVFPESEPISFQVKAGEIVALAGLMGAGRTSLLESIFGVRPYASGAVKVDNLKVRRGDPSASVKRGMAIVPEDRKVGGAVLSMSILRNGILPRLKKFSSLGIVRTRDATRSVSEAMDSVHLRYMSLGQEVGTLSGGNQQKVVIARWLTEDVGVLILDEPTRGVDVGARSEIYRVIYELARDRSMAVLFASSDMPEIIGLADRTLVMREGRVVHEVSKNEMPDPEARQAQIFRHAAGIHENEEFGVAGGH